MGDVITVPGVVATMAAVVADPDAMAEIAGGVVAGLAGDVVVAVPGMAGGVVAGVIVVGGAVAAGLTADVVAGLAVDVVTETREGMDTNKLTIENVLKEKNSRRSADC